MGFLWRCDGSVLYSPQLHLSTAPPARFSGAIARCGVSPHPGPLPSAAGPQDRRAVIKSPSRRGNKKARETKSRKQRTAHPESSRRGGTCVTQTRARDKTRPAIYKTTASQGEEDRTEQDGGSKMGLAKRIVPKDTHKQSRRPTTTHKQTPRHPKSCCRSFSKP